LDKNFIQKEVKAIIQTKDTKAKGKGLEAKFQDKKITNFINNFDRLITDISKLEGEIWIGQKDKLLYKVDLTSYFIDKESEMQFSLQIKAENADFNKKFEITEPANFKTWEQMMSEIERNF
jgi:hypothetical protein